MNAFTSKPDVSKFLKAAQTDKKRSMIATRKIIKGEVQHLQSKQADPSKARIK